MKVVLINGNPRADGITAKLSGIFAEGIRDASGELSVFDIERMNIKMCRGCFACITGGKGKCVMNDDMASIIDKMLKADCIACFTPLYFYSMTAQTKMFFDRCFPLFRGNFHSSSETPSEEKSSLEGKRFAAFTVGAGRSKELFSAVSQTWKFVASSLGLELIANIRRGESAYLGRLGEDSVRVKKILSAFRLAGEEFGKCGDISREIVELAEEYISPNESVFENKSKQYWRLIRDGKKFGA